MSDLSLYEDTLKFYFVLSEGSDQWDDFHPMKYAKQKLEENVSMQNILDIKPCDLEKLSHTFTKKHIIIFEEFAGECFNKMRETQALVLGPRCVISCFMDNTSIPSIPSPIFNLAMRGLIVCLSSFDVREKQNYRTLVNYMGGYCFDQLTGNVTHLVTDSVKSKKYEKAVMQNMKIMKSSWVHDVWARSTNENILATNEEFDKHAVPAFYNLAVTTTGLSKKDKKLIEELVEANGGTYRGEFCGSIINIVIAKRNSEETPKLKAALNALKDCLCIEWIIDSAKKGYALPLDEYRINLQINKKTSTPEKKPSGNYNFNATGMSADLSHIQFTGTINDTANLSGVSDSSVLQNRRSFEPAPDANELAYKLAFEKLNLSNAKKAGLFLDGCNIFLCGFANEEKEKIVKILNAGGATRYDTINSNLSHILVGNPSKKDSAMLNAVRYDAALVKLEWLVDSITAKTAITDCHQYTYHLNGAKQGDANDDGAFAPSPASKRNILSMSGMLSKQANPKRLNFDGNKSNGSSEQNKSKENENAESLLLDQYLNAQDIPEPVPSTSSTRNVFKVPKAVEPPISSSSDLQSGSSSENTVQTMTEETQVQYLKDLKVYIHGFSDDSTESMIQDCEAAGAEVHVNQNYAGIIDYLILPLDAMNMDDITIKSKHIVNQNWLINAKKVNQITEIPFFYEPIFFSEDLKPLAGMVVVFSIYASDERYYLIQLAQILGADVQESFVRGNRPLLICPEAKSPKYEAAIRWHLSVVSREWLMDCHKRERRLPLKNYLVGKSIAPVDDVEDDDEIVCSQPIHENVNAQGKRPLEEPSMPTNRRVDQLRGPSKSKKPAIPGENEFEDCFKDLDTPTREHLKKQYQEIENLTPKSKRRCFEENGVKTPECATTPYILEQRRQIFEELREPYLPSTSATKEKEKTPWTEYKRKFWKEYLGDEYESPSQCYAMNTQHDVSAVNDSIRPTGRHLEFDPPDESEADRNIQKLADFIKNRNQDDDASYDALPNTVPPESEMPNSEQHEVIGWHDPTEEVTASRSENSKKISSGITPIFSLSNTAGDGQLKIIDKIKSLKGTFKESPKKYDKTCTHLLCERPSSSEKILSGIAGGKWILSLDYIEKSHAAGQFLDEELFEWGNPKATTLPALKQTEADMAAAACRWRQKVQSTGKKAFENFNAILLTSKNDGLRTLIESGGGKIIAVRDGQPLHKQMSELIEASHVICQPRFTKLSDADYKALKEAKTPALTMNYLKSYIVEEKTPDINSFLFT